MEKIWKDTVVAHSRHYTGILLQGQKASFRIASVPEEIRNEYLPKERKLT
jgi:hypothetical protein